MFGAHGKNNVATRTFGYRVTDTTRPKCHHNGNKVIECKKSQYFDLIHQYKPHCTDTCGVVDKVISSIGSKYARFPARSTTHFSFSQKDSNSLTGTVAATIKVIDTTPPVLEISDGGHSHRTFNQLGEEQKILCTLADHKICEKYAKGECKDSTKKCRIPFSYEVSREMGFDWANEKRIENRLGDKKEALKVKEMMKAGTGYKCIDTCGKTKTVVSVHVNQERKRDGIACDGKSLNTANQVPEYLVNQPWTFVIKYACTDGVGLTATKCRTITNSPGKFKKAIKAYVSVPADIDTMAIADAMEGFFWYEHRAMDVRGSLCRKPSDPCGLKQKPPRDDILAKMGKVVSSRRLGETLMRQDVFKIAAKPAKLRKIYRALTSCEFAANLAKELALKCKTIQDTTDVVVECVKVDDIAVPVEGGEPIIVIPDLPDNANGYNDVDTEMDPGNKMMIEAMSDWFTQNPDNEESTKAYCVDTRCSLENTLDCPGRLPIGTAVVEVVDGDACAPPKEGADPTTTPKPTVFKAMDNVNTKLLGNYVITYTCMVNVDGVKMEASDKMRDILVVDTTKPICDVKVGKVTREASFPYALSTPVCTDTYWGHKGMNPATVTLGSFDIEKVSGPKGYVLTYTATDHSSNVAVFKKSTVIVVDTLKPVIELAYSSKKFHRSNALDKGVNGQANPVHKPL
jgi:hypothetical protein